MRSADRSRRFLGVLLSLYVAPGLGGQAAAQKTVLTVVHGEERTIAMDEDAIARFEADHPDVDVELVWSPSGRNDRILAIMAAGNAPDLIYQDIGAPVTEWVTQGRVIDLTPYVERHPEHFAGWIPAVLDLTKTFGRQWALPRQNLTTYATWYNIDHFEEAGLAPPASDWTWDDFRAIARRLTRDLSGDGTLDRFAYDNSFFFWHSWVKNAGGSVYDETGRRVVFDSPESRKAIEFLHALRWEDHVMPQPGELQRSGVNGFLDGNTSMIQRQPLFWQQVRDAPAELRTGVVLEPVGPGPVQYTMANTNAWMIPVGSKNPDLAFELLMYLTDERTGMKALEVGAMPIHVELVREYFGAGVDVRNFRETYFANTGRPLFSANPALPDSGGYIARIIAETVDTNRIDLAQAFAQYIPAAQAGLDEFWAALGR